MRVIVALLAATSLVAGLVPAVARAGDGDARVFAPGRSLDGVRIGMTKAEVVAAWGARHGVCRDCGIETWYFNDRPFFPQGTAAALERGTVVAAYTVWRPLGFRTSKGLTFAASAAEVARLVGPLDRRECDGYYALLDEGARSTAVYYVFGNRLWGFGLTVPDASPCVP